MGTYQQIPAAGGTVDAPSVSFSQPWGWNGVTQVVGKWEDAHHVPGESTNTLTVSFENLKGAKDKAGNPITVDGSSTVYVNYEAKLVAGKINADMLGKAQVNNVKLTYSNNPYNTSDTGTTVDHPAYDYTYGIDVTKVGSDKDETGNLKKLQGVQFTLKEEGSNEFIKADGTTPIRP